MPLLLLLLLNWGRWADGEVRGGGAPPPVKLFKGEGDLGGASCIMCSTCRCMNSISAGVSH